MIEPTKVTVGGHEYTLGRLDIFQSLNVARLAAPVLPVLFHEVLSKIALEVLKSPDEAKATAEERIATVGMLIYMSAPVLKELAKMPEEDFNTVIKTSLACVERHNGKTWSPVILNGQIAYQDMSQQDVMTLVIHVLARELRPTIAALGFFGSAAESNFQKGTGENSPMESIF